MPQAVKTSEAQLYHVSQLQISQAAFMRVAGERIINRDPQVEIERAFSMFDQDRKGYIVLEDLRRVSRDLGESGLEEDELNAMVNEFDYDGTGTVAKEAFYAICLQ
jgi:centrin-3